MILIKLADGVTLILVSSNNIPCLRIFLDPIVCLFGTQSLHQHVNSPTPLDNSSTIMVTRVRLKELNPKFRYSQR